MIETIAKKTAWEIIEELSKRDKTPTELSKKLKISLANVNNLLLKMQGEGIVKEVGKIKGARGRPFTKYGLGSGFVYLVEAIPRETRKIFLEKDENILVHLRIWSLPHKEVHYYVEKFWWQIQDILDDIGAVAIFGSVVRHEALRGSDIDLLIISDKKIERKIKTRITSPEGKSRIIVPTILSEKELIDMVEKGSPFIKQIVRDMIIIYDKKNILWSLKK